MMFVFVFVRVLFVLVVVLFVCVCCGQQPPPGLDQQQQQQQQKHQNSHTSQSHASLDYHSYSEPRPTSTSAPSPLPRAPPSSPSPHRRLLNASDDEYLQSITTKELCSALDPLYAHQVEVASSGSSSVLHPCSCSLRPLFARSSLGGSSGSGSAAAARGPKPRKWAIVLTHTREPNIALLQLIKKKRDFFFLVMQSVSLPSSDSPADRRSSGGGDAAEAGPSNAQRRMLQNQHANQWHQINVENMHYMCLQQQMSLSGHSSSLLSSLLHPSSSIYTSTSFFYAHALSHHIAYLYALQHGAVQLWDVDAHTSEWLADAPPPLSEYVPAHVFTDPNTATNADHHTWTLQNKRQQDVQFHNYRGDKIGDAQAAGRMLPLQPDVALLTPITNQTLFGYYQHFGGYQHCSVEKESKFRYPTRRKQQVKPGIYRMLSDTHPFVYSRYSGLFGSSSELPSLLPPSSVRVPVQHHVAHGHVKQIVNGCGLDMRKTKKKKSEKNKNDDSTPQHDSDGPSTLPPYVQFDETAPSLVLAPGTFAEFPSHNTLYHIRHIAWALAFPASSFGVDASEVIRSYFLQRVLWETQQQVLVGGPTVVRNVTSVFDTPDTISFRYQSHRIYTLDTTHLVKNLLSWFPSTPMSSGTLDLFELIRELWSAFTTPAFNSILSLADLDVLQAYLNDLRDIENISTQHTVQIPLVYHHWEQLRHEQGNSPHSSSTADNIPKPYSYFPTLPLFEPVHSFVSSSSSSIRFLHPVGLHPSLTECLGVPYTPGHTCPVDAIVYQPNVIASTTYQQQAMQKLAYLDQHTLKNETLQVEAQYEELIKQIHQSYIDFDGDYNSRVSIGGCVGSFCSPSLRTSPFISFVFVFRLPSAEELQQHESIDYQQRLDRIQTHLDFIDEMTAAHDIDYEVVLVEYKPFPTSIPLESAIVWPRRMVLQSRCRVLSYLAPLPAWPQGYIYETFDEEFNFYEFIGKNLGIRRARGLYVVSGHIDAVWHNLTYAEMHPHQLRPNLIYRTHRRWEPFKIKLNHRVFGYDRVWPLLRRLSKLETQSKPPAAPPNYKHIEVEAGTPGALYSLHPPGCVDELYEFQYIAGSDFTLLSTSLWHSIYGHVELPYNFDIDTVLLCRLANALSPHPIGEWLMPGGVAPLQSSKSIRHNLPAAHPLLDASHHPHPMFHTCHLKPLFCQERKSKHKTLLSQSERKNMPEKHIWYNQQWGKPNEILPQYNPLFITLLREKGVF